MRIVLISTVHKDIGKCNSEVLCEIIESIKPDVIFLEELEENYSQYDRIKFSQFGVYKERLELKTIQAYSQNNTFDYVPVLDVGLSDEFDTKVKIVSENKVYQRLLDDYIRLEREYGFEFLNSNKSIMLQEEMRQLENHIINNENFHRQVNASIDEYENSMLRKIYLFCEERIFNTAIFMCGAAHRKSIIEKIKTSESKIHWTFYNETL
jgi:hypothetical protein